MWFKFERFLIPFIWKFKIPHVELLKVLITTLVLIKLFFIIKSLSLLNRISLLSNFYNFVVPVYINFFLYAKLLPLADYHLWLNNYNYRLVKCCRTRIKK